MRVAFAAVPWVAAVVLAGCAGAADAPDASDPGSPPDALPADVPGADAPRDLPDAADDATGPLDDGPGDATADPGSAPAPVNRIADVDLLIVTTAAMRAPFDDLADWKTRRGLPAKVVVMEDVLEASGVPDEALALREAIRGYAAGGTRWVLLGGDAPLVPRREVHCRAYNAAEDTSLDADVASDLYFADLDGTWDADGDGTFGEPEDGLGDMLPDVFAGRVPAADAAGARRYVDKVFAYERRPVPDYQDTAVFLGEVVSEMEGISICSTAVFESAMVPCFPEAFRIDKLYETSCGTFEDASPNTLSAQEDLWARGRSHVVMDLGHGNLDTLGWVVDFDGFPATDRPAVFLTCQCNTCEFDADRPAACERFLTDAWGGVVFLGNSDWGVGFPWETLFYEHFLYGVFGAPADTVGERFAQSLAQYGVPQGGDLDAPLSDFRWTQFTLHLMGDPTLRIWTARPGTAGVEVRDGCDGAGPCTAVRVSSGTPEAPVAGATVAIHRPGDLLYVATTGADGRAAFPGVGQGTLAGARLTVTHPLLAPFEGSVPAVP